MSAYLIVDIKVHDPESYQEYVRRVPALIAKHGGTYLVRGGDAEVFEGAWELGRLVVLQFPDMVAAKAFINDPEYAPVAAIRHAAATTDGVLVEGFTDD